MYVDKKDAPEVSQIIDLISTLNTRVTLDKELGYISDDQFDRIVENVKALKVKVYNHKIFSEPTKDRLEELTDIMTSIALLDFSKKAFVTEQGNHLDYIAIGLNLLSFQLNKHISPIRDSFDALESLQFPFITTDLKGIITGVNRHGILTTGFKRANIIGRKIHEVIDETVGKSALIFKNKYHLPIVLNKAILRNTENIETGFSYLCLPDKVGLQDSFSYQAHTFDFFRVHHDVINPVKNIKELVKIGKEENANASVRKLFDKCRIAIEDHLKDLFDVLFMRSEKAEQDVIDLKELVSNLMVQFSHYPGFTEVEFKTGIAVNKKISADKKLITTILQNLIGNAIKYMRPDGKPLVSVSVRLKADRQLNKNFLVIEIKDNGIGIEKATLSDIFKPHFRGTIVAEGKGMGLYIVKQAVEKLGGTISVESFPGIGTSFRTSIPVSV